MAGRLSTVVLFPSSKMPFAVSPGRAAEPEGTGAVATSAPGSPRQPVSGLVHVVGTGWVRGNGRGQEGPWVSHGPSGLVHTAAQCPAASARGDVEEALHRGGSGSGRRRCRKGPGLEGVCALGPRCQFTPVHCLVWDQAAPVSSRAEPSSQRSLRGQHSAKWPRARGAPRPGCPCSDRRLWRGRAGAQGSPIPVSFGPGPFHLPLSLFTPATAAS